MVKFLLETVFLLTALGLTFFWTNDPHLSYYTLQLVAFFLLLFFLNQFIARRRKKRINLTIDATIFILVIFLLIGSSGGLSSPLFFLVYFLMFGLALLFDPLITFSLALAMTIVFFLSPSKQSLMEEIWQLVSLLLITPLALFFSKKYLQLLEDEEKIKVLKTESKALNQAITKEESGFLLWESLDFKTSLVDIIEQASLALSDVSKISVRQKERLLKIKQRALNLLKSGEKLKKEIDETTDEK